MTMPKSVFRALVLAIFAAVMVSSHASAAISLHAHAESVHAADVHVNVNDVRIDIYYESPVALVESEPDWLEVPLGAPVGVSGLAGARADVEWEESSHEPSASPAEDGPVSATVLAPIPLPRAGAFDTAEARPLGARILAALHGAWEAVASVVSPSSAPTARGSVDAASSNPRVGATAASPEGAASPEAGALLLAASAAVAVGWAAGLGQGLGVHLKRLLGVLGVGGFTRLDRNTLLDHAARDRLYTLVLERPGASLRDLVGATSVGRTAVSYHLRVLEREGLVSSSRVGRRRLYFPTGANGPGRGESAAFAALAHETARSIAVGVAGTPGLDQKALCARLGLRPSLAHWHVDRLEGAGLVTRVKEGRHVRYYPGPLAEKMLPVAH